MGLFILGVLVGWLLEWLFVRFVMKADIGSSDIDQSVTHENASTGLAKNTDNRESVTASDSEDSQQLTGNTSDALSSSESDAGKDIEGDDFTRLSGIGPSMRKTLHSLGITSFKALANTQDDDLKAMLQQAGAKMNNNKDVMASWNEQAELAHRGDWDGLKRLQETLKQ